MIPQLLEMLEFRSNNDIHRPVIQALELLKKYAQSKARYYDSGEDIPIDGVLKSGWKEILLEKDPDGKERINRINYENGMGLMILSFTVKAGSLPQIAWKLRSYRCYLCTYCKYVWCM